MTSSFESPPAGEIEELEIATTRRVYRRGHNFSQSGMTREELESLAEMIRQGKLRPDLKGRLVEAIVRQRDDGLFALVLKVRKAVQDGTQDND